MCMISVLVKAHLDLLLDFRHPWLDGRGDLVRFLNLRNLLIPLLLLLHLLIHVTNAEKFLVVVHRVLRSSENVKITMMSQAAREVVNAT